MVMDPDLLLDLLGNENRRRILQLLSRKPCYVTEISNTIQVAPKAVIEHLELLEEGGLIEAYFDPASPGGGGREHRQVRQGPPEGRDREHHQVRRQRRKYYHISEDLLVEVRLAPSGFGSVLEEVDEDEEAPSLWDALPPDWRPEIPRWLRPEGREPGESKIPRETRSLAEAARVLEEMRGLREEVRALQRFLLSRAGELGEALSREAGRLADDPRDGAVLAAVARGARTPAEVQRETGSLPAEAEMVLRRLQERRLVRRRGDGWVVEERV